MRPTHHPCRKSIDDEIEAWLRGIALEHGCLNAKLVAFSGGPRQLVEILTKERPVGKPSEFSLSIAGWRRGRRRKGTALLRGARRLNNQAQTEHNRHEGRGRQRCRNFHNGSFVVALTADLYRPGNPRNLPEQRFVRA